MLCPICSHLNVLCSVCESELASGKLTKSEIDVTRQLVRKNVKIRPLSVFDLGRKLVIQVNSGEKEKIPLLWKDTLIVESRDVNLKELFSPVALKTSKVFLPNGTTGSRVSVSKSELKSAGFNVAQLERATKRLLEPNSVRFI